MLIPVHRLILQSFSWKRGPLQFSPPFAGEGFVQYLSRDLRAVLPQASGQLDHVVHCVNAPSTVEKVGKMDSKWMLQGEDPSHLL